MQHAIIEFKARCGNPARIREILKIKNARFVGEDHQIDTYFRVPQGRLKLREGDIENALVFYSRADQAAPKQSDVSLSEVEKGSELKPVLSKALGVIAVVDKRREIYFVGNVKIHMDRVEGLGEFLEVEAIGTANNVARLREQCEDFRMEFGVKQEDLVQGSYSDLMLP